MSKKKDYITKTAELAGVSESVVSTIVDHAYRYAATRMGEKSPVSVHGLGSFRIYPLRKKILDEAYAKLKEQNDSSIVQSDNQLTESDSEATTP